MAHHTTLLTGVAGSVALGVGSAGIGRAAWLIDRTTLLTGIAGTVALGARAACTSRAAGFGHGTARLAGVACVTYCAGLACATTHTWGASTTALARSTTSNGWCALCLLIARKPRVAGTIAATTTGLAFPTTNWAVVTHFAIGIAHEHLKKMCVLRLSVVAIVIRAACFSLVSSLPVIASERVVFAALIKCAVIPRGQGIACSSQQKQHYHHGVYA